jgi:hypothetical protein
MWLIITFAVIVVVLGHATRRWMRTSHETTQAQAAASLIDSEVLTLEERQRLRERLKSK